jgi:OHCU decarboxylase
LVRTGPMAQAATFRAFGAEAMSSLPTDVERLNSLSASEAEKELLKCCGSENWARQLVGERPFTSVKQLTETSDRIWWSLDPQDWLQAFHSHPKIGEKKSVAVTSARAQKWSEAEQSGTRDSAQSTMDALAHLNREYEQKFGFIFIVCATGKTSEEMLTNLRDRLKNDPSDELRIAAGEQAKITRLRLNKLIDTLRS